MQNFEEKNLYAFICLIRNKPSLFTDKEKLQKLYDTCVNLMNLKDLEEKVTRLSNAVSEWCQQPSNFQIHEEFAKQRRLHFGVPGDERLPGTDEDHLPDFDIQVIPQVIQDILSAPIQQSPTPDTPQPPNS